VEYVCTYVILLHTVQTNHDQHHTHAYTQIPESAKVALFQEEKLKGHYHDLRWLLDEYHRVVTRVIPVTVRFGLYLFTNI
jgi:hypothetical protein